MLNKITMPSAGQTTDTLTIARWLKAEGDAVKRGDILIEVETDKANLEVESFAKGTLLKILYQEGDSVRVGEVIAYVGAAGDLDADEMKEAQPSPKTSLEDDDYAPILPEPAGAITQPPGKNEPPNRKMTGTGNIQASPAAKKAARDRDIAIAEVAEKYGKPLIKRADVVGFTQPSSRMDEYDLVPLSSMRKTIATRMFESTNTIPSYTVEIEVDMTALIGMRAGYKKSGVKVAFHDMFAKCVAVAIADHPYINGSYSEDGLRLHKAVNVGIAVAIDAGLIVPVVRNVRAKRILEIAAESAALVEKARSGRLTQPEMQGGTITISNLGAYPISRFTAIINPPESCILAIGGTVKRPFLVNGALEEHSVAVITATFDHRIIDGAYGAAFLADVKRYIETPSVML